MNRREFVTTAAMSAAFVRASAHLRSAPRYDIVITGGRVIDPSLRIDGVRDVAIADGRIAAVEASVADGAAQTIDARGKLVVPGLLDIHTHAARVADGPSLCLRDGVTGFIDAGSQGADRIGDVIAIAK